MYIYKIIRKDVDYLDTQHAYKQVYTLLEYSVNDNVHQLYFSNIEKALQKGKEIDRRH